MKLNQLIFGLFALAGSAFASTYACVNTSADPTALNAALAAGGTVVLTVTGPTCLLGPTSLQIPSNVSLLASGTVKLSYTGGGVLGFVNGNNVSINGFTIEGGGLLTTQSSTSTPQSNVAITNNTFQNITANGANTAGIASSGYWSHFTITGNAFNNISTVPIGLVTSGTNVENGVGGLNCSWSGGTNNCFGVGVNNENGMDNTLIEHNTFNFELGDAIRIVYNWTSSTGTTYHTAANNSISYNTYINLHRMAIESQGVSANPSSCIGSCIFPASAVSNLKMTANFAYQFVAPYVETFFLSIPIGAPDPIVYNNTGVSSGAGSYGYCFENAFTSATMRGNVCSSATGGHWAVAFQTGSSSPGPILYQNNWFAGSGQTNFGQEGSCSSCWTQQFNQINSAPDNASAPQTSNITTGSSTVAPSGTSATLNAWATGEISILNTQFKLDGALITTQEISNVNSNFTTDRHWLYSNTFTGLASGSHTVQAIATDLTGATSTTTQTFTIAGTSSLSIARVDYTDHSVTRVVVDATFVMTGAGVGACAPNGCVARSRSTVLPATCLGNTNGLTQPMEIGGHYHDLSPPDPTTNGGTRLLMVVAGLTPGTAYDICPEVSKDGGTVWQTGVDVHVTTLAAPAIDPEPPHPPKRVTNWQYPDTSNSALWVTVTLAADCNDLGPQYVAAVGRQATQGTIIKIPVGTKCGTVAAGGNWYFTVNPPDVQTWQSSNVSGNQITLGGTPTLISGQAIRFGLQYLNTPPNDMQWPLSGSCEFGNGLVAGPVFYVDSVINSANNTVTLKCDQDGVPGAAMVFTNTGNDRGRAFYWVPRDRTNHQIIFRSAAADNQLPPPGVDISPAYLPYMAIMSSQLTNLGVQGDTGCLICFTNNDGNAYTLADNIRIGPGIKATHEDSTEAHSTSDPTPWYTMLDITPTSSNVFMDRVYWDMLGAPNRVVGGIRFNGYNTAIVNNYFTGIDYYYPEYLGLTTAKTGSNTLSVAAGNANYGTGMITIPARTVTLAGTATARVFVGLDLANANAFTVWTPSGETATCSPACANATVSGATNSSCNVSDGWPKNGNGNPTAGPISCVNISGGVIGTVTMANATNPTGGAPVSVHFTEGAQWLTAGIGPGPTLFYGNDSFCVGLCYHYDDGGHTTNIRGDFEIWRNDFVTPFKYMYNPANPSANPASDGLSHFLRQTWEEKAGRRTDVHGNKFRGMWNEVEASAGFTLFTSVAGMGIRDVNVRNNTFLHGPGVASLAFVTAGSNYAMTPPVLRYQLDNNLAYDIGNPLFFAGRQANPVPGWVGEGPNATQDVIIKRNTIINPSGGNPEVMWPFDTNTEGVSVTNNILNIEPARQGLEEAPDEPNVGQLCKGLIGKASADCKFTPSYTWANNLMVGIGQTPTQVHNAWPTLPNYFQSGSTNLATVGWTKYATPSTTPTEADLDTLNLDFRLLESSPWKAGAAGLNNHFADVGVNINELYADQGRLTVQGVPDRYNGTTSASVAYTPADAGVCWVDISTTDPDAIAVGNMRFQDAGGSRNRLTPMTGLTTKTFYYGVVRCSGNGQSQKPFQFKTN